MSYLTKLHFNIFFQIDLGSVTQEIAVVCDFDIKENLIGISRSVQPKLASVIDKSGVSTPCLKDDPSFKCNCQRYPAVGKVGMKENLPQTSNGTGDIMNGGDEFDSSEGEISEASSTEETAEDLEIIQYTEIFSLKGVSYHPEFQVTIAHCRKYLAENQAVSVHLRHEQDNGEDKNAVIVETFLQGHWKPIGYIPGKKVPKVHHAMHGDEIKSTAIRLIQRKYIYALQTFLYIPTIVVVKTGLWLHNDNDYTYNQIIDMQ